MPLASKLLSWRLLSTVRACKKLLTCASSSSRIQPFPSTRRLASPRLFSTASPLLKKKGGRQQQHEQTYQDAEQALKGKPPIADDPFDFSALDDEIAKTHKSLSDTLSRLRMGGRLDPQVLENLRVKLDKTGKATVKLGDVATVVPKGGRSMVLLVGEEQHIKPVSAALLASSFNLNAQPSPTSQSPLELQVPIPPPTQESRLEAQKQASAEGEKALQAVRNARQVCHKRLKKMFQDKKVRPDDKVKADKEMEAIVQKGAAEVKKTVEAARKAAMG